ncbi:CvpA family protein [Aliarcobacter thereius]|uniref:Colicin V production protein n=2 Tax=Aliarcobacter thereius TaxID=544718 RepID=A0A1C0B628_9BACT|nr:CvpA family protein [Aliarcobacter thereius]OCL96422.1 colicin V production protein [Aliarcobacter thereius LMG 24486]OCL98616.1 colicin V production protein [Aliarcobacter thereius]QBF15616.1 CvpA family membrane protein [Aliarcobacter thereius LMG 24486]TLS92596.1 CvpA family protein [Aliarcobacter thereius]TLT06881.1 CvpA family protein [Aliarcobacter thereius]
MQDLAMFDVIIILITLFLGLKGFFKGFIKEFFALLGIIGAIFVASRISFDVGQIVAPILAIENSSTIKLIGFIISVITVWFVVYVAGIIVSKIFSLSGLGIVDRIFGLIFGAAKIFLIFSVIASALYSIESFKKSIDENFKNSIVMPHLLSVGEFIMKIDTSAISEKFDAPTKEILDQTSKSIDSITGAVNDGAKEITESAKEKIYEEIEKEVSRQAQQLEDEINVQKNRLDDIYIDDNKEGKKE